MVVAAKDKECRTGPGASSTATGNGMRKCSQVALADEGRAEEENLLIIKQLVQESVVLLAIPFKQ